MVNYHEAMASEVVIHWKIEVVDEHELVGPKSHVENKSENKNDKYNQFRMQTVSYCLPSQLLVSFKDTKRVFIDYNRQSFKPIESTRHRNLEHTIQNRDN